MVSHTWCSRRAIAFLLFTITGCTNANRELNDTHVPLQLRKTNQTRAAMFTDGRSTLSGDDIPTTQSTRTFPMMAGGSAPVDQDGFFVGMSISGGGSRSSNFSAACMFQLERLGLLQKVDYISSVSGGSLTAAYYCVSGNEWNPGNVQKKLTHSFASDLIGRSMLPWNIFAVMFSNWDRTDILAGVFRDELFSRAGRELTFADLRPDRPRLLINSTDLQSGRRFVFSNESFDEINSDLSKYPMSYAVAASAAVPVVLHPVTCRDFSTSFPQYRHLIDGGMNDNLGVETLLSTYAGQRAAARVAGRPDPYPNGAVLIVVNAHTKFNTELASESDIGVFESLKVALGLASSSMLERINTANLSDVILRNASGTRTAAQLRDEIHQLHDTGYLEVNDPPSHSIRVIYLSLAQVNTLHNLPFGNFNESLNGIATYFNITDREAYHLYEAAELLVREKFEGKIRKVVDDVSRGATTRNTQTP